MDKVRILNIDIDNRNFQGFLEQLEMGLVVTPNVDHLMKLQRDRAFYDCYLKAEHVVCDSRIVQLASRFLYAEGGIVEQIAGSDLLPAWCVYHGRKASGERIFLLGGSTESVELAQKNLDAKAGCRIVAGVYSPPFGFENDESESASIVARVNESGATVLAMGVGAPKQELWIQRYRDELPGVKVFMAVGAAIEFEAGIVRRAPAWVTRAGLEWLHRLIQEPVRLTKRYLFDDLPFFWLILKQKMGLYKNPWANLN